MFTTIVVGIDGRPQDDDAVALAQQLAAPGARLIAASIAGLGDGPFEAGTLEAGAARLDAAQTLVDRFTTRHPAFTGIATAAPSPSKGLAHVAVGEAADLIVVGSSKRATIDRWLVGGAVWRLLHHAPCPVAVAPIGYAPGALNRVVVGFDGSPTSEAAVRLALKLTVQHAGSLVPVEVIDPVIAVPPTAGSAAGDPVPIELADARANLDHLRDSYGLHGVVSVGWTAHELAEASEDADLLVVGFEEPSLVERLLGSSTTRRLLRHHAAPMLVVPGVSNTTASAQEETTCSNG